MVLGFPLLPVLSHPTSAPSFATFHEDKPLEQLSGLQSADFNSKVKADARCVLREDESGTNVAAVADDLTCTDAFEYFRLRFSSLPPDFLAAIQPLSPLLLAPRTQSNLWLGRAGLVTHAHFDLQFNFFVQVEGRKTFTLFAPDSQLRLYPNVHPHQAHVWPAPHVKPEAENLCAGFTASAGDQGLSSPSNPNLQPRPLRPFVASLGPGDMLLVPPLWFHHVRTDSRSVSINVWSDADEYEAMDRVYALPIPLESHWSLQDRVSSSLYYIRRLVIEVMLKSELIGGEHNEQNADEAGASTDAADLQSRWFLGWMARWMKLQRFHEPLLGEMLERMQPLAPEDEQDRAAVRESCSGGLVAASRRAIRQWQTPDHEARWTRGLTPLIKQFEHIRSVSKPVHPTRAFPATSAFDLESSAEDRSITSQSASIASLLLANYVEWLLFAMLGDRVMLWFIDSCVR